MSDHDPEQETPEQETQEELREDVATHDDDPVTKREALETHLMEEDASGSGEEIGDPTP